MVKVTPYQKDILIALNNGATLCTTEGANFSCWLQRDSDRYRTVRKDTVGLLFDKGCIKSVEDNTKYYFMYKLTKKGELIALRK